MIIFRSINFNRKIKEIHKDLLKRRTYESNIIEKVIEEFNKKYSPITKTSVNVKR